MRLTRYATSAAVAVGTLAGVLWLGGGTASAFEKAMANAGKAKSFRSVAAFKIGNDISFKQTVYLQGTKFRMEAGDTGVVIGDGETKTGLQLDTANKTAAKLDLAKLGESKMAQDVTGLVKKLSERKGEGVEALADEVIDGRTMNVFLVKGHKLNDTATDVKVWIDSELELPARFQIDLKVGEVKAAVDYQYHDWNKAFDPKLFSTEVPEGYKVVDPPKLPAKAESKPDKK